LQQSCNRAATELQQATPPRAHRQVRLALCCNRAATELQQSYSDSFATEAWP
jgi:hypothetical protein